ncbi:MAG: DNA topoisomerase, partial [candidate division WOR-3 bacterium]
MAKKAVIVESPTKAKTIKGFLGRDYLVLSSSGHIKDLPKSKLGIAIDNNFEPTYITIKGKKRIISEIKKAVENNVDEVYLGCDPDREGEAIAYHIAQELNSDHRSETGKPKIHRVLFYEITPSFVRSALLHPTDINFKKVDAHKARRVLDRIFGYFTSPLLWRILRRGLSAGRVQTVALRLLCEREDEIIAFKPVPYWVVEAIFKTQENVEIKTSLHSIKGKSQRIEDEEI